MSTSRLALPGRHVAFTAFFFAFLTDRMALDAFCLGQSMSSLTSFEGNIPTSALDLLGRLKPIRPGRRAWKVSKTG